MTDPAAMEAAHVTDLITDLDQLHALYGTPPEGALRKELTHLTPEYQRWISASPFCSLASVGPEGLDCSPRGDAEQAAFVIDEKTLHIPDRRGNNRLDTLRNIVRDGRVALLWLIPGITEAMRVNGTAVLSADPELRARYAVDDKLPATVIVITVHAAYFQCARAIKRSGLWHTSTHVDPATLPTAGQMTKGADFPEFDSEAYDAALQERQARTLY